MATNAILQIFENGSQQPVFIRPTPLISIQRNSLSNAMGTFGSTYTITLTGTLIDNAGGVALVSAADPARTIVPDDEAAWYIFDKIDDLKRLFSSPTLRFAISSADGSKIPDTTFIATLQSLDFQEGQYINIARYTAVFEADFMTDDAGVLHDGDVMGAIIETSDNRESFSGGTAGDTLSNLRTKFGGIISDYNESWSIETDESLGMTGSEYDHITSARSYVITREVSITGRDYYELSGGTNVKYEAWSEAKNFAEKSVLTDLAQEYPDYPQSNLFGKSVINLSSQFGGFNHMRSESIDKSAGVVNISDTWLMCSGIAFENYEASVSAESENSTVSVTLNGTIKGVSSLPASGTFYGGNDAGQEAKPYENALLKYNEVSNDGEFGASSILFKRANNLLTAAVNPRPRSVTISENKFAGEIAYSITFDNRPTTIITDAISENISVNDTYPGDLFALIPVIGRPYGPILQYIGGRTEYRRDVSVELVFDYHKITQGSENKTIREKVLLTKPTLSGTTQQEINDLLKAVSPLSEPNIRKCFLNPPRESWSPTDARYSLSLSWVYELGDGATTQTTPAPPIPGQT